MVCSEIQGQWKVLDSASVMLGEEKGKARKKKEERGKIKKEER